ncbi:MAG TPA: PQQ-binding-like beta-propeller repeat protein [Steroidobacteraceae bacterium]|nr:PQQ-binding-like beta-propeller repeat protein [Steroidobacteraceae bacterium]
MISRAWLIAILAAAAAVSTGVGCAVGAQGRGDADSADSAASPGSAADWPAYNRTLAGDRFSPLTQVQTSNVARLALQCTYELPEVSSFQTGPIVVAGTMYFTTDQNSYAMDARTCQLKWTQHRTSARPSRLNVNRGFAYLDGMLFRGTSDGHVVGLSAADGHQLWDHRIEVEAPGMSIPMAPIAFGGRVYVGTAGGDNVGVTGHVFALDAQDGHQIWRFDSVPEGPIRRTWTNPQLPISGGGFWTSFSYDAAKGILYVPAGNAAPDFDTLDRTGEDLYSNSVIAIDAASGRILAYRQLVPQDSHDWDVDSAPALVTTRRGRQIIASANKDGLLSILDRSDIHVSQQDGAAQGTVPAGTAPLIPLLSQTPTTTRSNVDVPLSREHPVHFCPGYNGGTEWNGAAYSPTTDSLFVAAVDRCATVQLEPTLKVPPAGDLWFAAAKRDFDPISQARGWLTAFNAENGQIRWKFHAAHPLLAGVTPTAGRVVFAADLAGVLYALDQRSGKLLWRQETGQALGGGIVSYAVDGQQRIAVASGMNSPVWPGGAQHSRVLVYGLSP